MKRRVLLLIYSLLILTACEHGRSNLNKDSNNPPTTQHNKPNSPPIAKDVTIKEKLSDYFVGDKLIVKYTYFDADGDKEGSTTFRWFRDGVEIKGENSSFYRLKKEDEHKKISVEIIPYAISGKKLGVAVISDIFINQVNEIDTPNFHSLINDAPFKVGLRRNYSISCNGRVLNDESSIRDTIKSANDGDCIIIEDGTYDLGEVKVKANNLKVISKNRWGCKFVGHTKLQIEGNNTLLQGVVFKDGDLDVGTEAEAIVVKSDNVHLSHIKIESWGSKNNGKWALAINIAPGIENLEISDSLFTDLYGIAILAGQKFESGFVSSKNIWIHHNKFYNNPRRKWASAGETVHMGTAYNKGQNMPGPSENYDDNTYMIFEYNNIVKHQAESELLSIKSGRNIIRYNRVIDSSSSAFVIRMGSENLIYGNWMVGNLFTPIRISGERNVFAFNYFKGTGSAITLHHEQRSNEGIPDIVDAYWVAKNNLIIQNIFQGYGTFIQTFSNKNGGKIVNTVFNNTIQGNILLNSSDKVKDFAGIIDAETIVKNNTITNNTFINSSKPNENRWKISSQILNSINKDIDLTTVSNLPWQSDTLSPPHWWLELFK